MESVAARLQNLGSFPQETLFPGSGKSKSTYLKNETFFHESSTYMSLVRRYSYQYTGLIQTRTEPLRNKQIFKKFLNSSGDFSKIIYLSTQQKSRFLSVLIV